MNLADGNINKSNPDSQNSIFQKYVSEIKNNDPWLVLEGMLSLEKKDLLLNTLNLIKKLLTEKLLLLDERAFIFFAKQCEVQNSIYTGDTLKVVSEILTYIPPVKDSADNFLLHIYLYESDRGLRTFSARIFDVTGVPASEQVICRLLGEESAKVLNPFLIYSRISYEDLLNLLPENFSIAPIAESIRECLTVCDMEVIKEVIAKAGWKHLSYGLTVKHYIGISCDNSFPLYVYENEAILFEKYTGYRRTSDYFVFTAHGGVTFESSDSRSVNKPVALFKTYNLAHAALLREILDVAPLSCTKIKRIIGLLDKIVEDFITLFKSYTDECRILPEIYNDIKTRVLKDLNSSLAEEQIPADITRLVQMFEDPRSIGDVHTLHGLKRYLHQKGLQLGFKLVDQSKSPNRNISLILTSGSRVLSVIKRINYADFEPVGEGSYSIKDIPYNIKIVIDAFERQLLSGLDNFPSVNIFSYGNEVHYFVWFRNHPIFIRIDYSPPLQGGMIDLQYFGVSNYEIADHPNIALDAIKYFFQLEEFDVTMNGTHIHARYDKERAFGLDQLCEKAEYLFRLVPYMMDLDWIIGSLRLDPPAKKKVINAWGSMFKVWGTLPYNKILTKNKLGILLENLVTLSGEEELEWKGDEDYRDLFTIPIPTGSFDLLLNAFNDLGLNIRSLNADHYNELGQIRLENLILNNLRSAETISMIMPTAEGYIKSTESTFVISHEAEWFAETIFQSGPDLEFSSALAKIIMTFGQILRFDDTGTLENFKVQSATLPLKGGKLEIYVLRDHNGIIRMSCYTTEDFLYKKKQGNQWISNVRLSAVDLISLMRINNYLTPGLEPLNELFSANFENIKSELSTHLKELQSNSLYGEKILPGLPAAPGRAVGRIIFKSYKRPIEDYNGKLLVAQSVSPEDTTILFHADGIIATGGGILSHAGLIASQFNKPAIIVSGSWVGNNNTLPILKFIVPVYQVQSKKVHGFNVTIRKILHEHELELREGDLVILDADLGTLEVLGQDTDTIALFEHLVSFGFLNESLSKVSNPAETLILRGKKLNIRHLLEKLFSRINDSVILRFAVQEILTGNSLKDNKCKAEERAFLINLLLQNNEIGDLTENFIAETNTKIGNNYITLLSYAQKSIPHSKHIFEIILPRLEVFQLNHLIKNYNLLLDYLSADNIELCNNDFEIIDNLSTSRLLEIQDILCENIRHLISKETENKKLRHLLRQFSVIEKLFDKTRPEHTIVHLVEDNYKKKYEHNLYSQKEKFIIHPPDGGLEIAPLIGWKAANLSEVQSIYGKELIPPWFVITDKAFQYVLDLEYSSGNAEVIQGTTLREKINNILSRKDKSNREKSIWIRNLWSDVSFPVRLRAEILNSYNLIYKNYLSGTQESSFQVALRSSSCEEDTEIAAKAGEFETYLYISGEDLLIDYIKRTWSGLWTERAIHNRYQMGEQNLRVSGGVIVQQMIWSRVSGVLLTINAAKKNLQEMVINAGLGMGEGIVSGIAAADQIIVSKEGNLEKGPLHFNYITSDKTGQVVFNKKAGFGTIFSPTLYHQRFRPALEYIELCELVSLASQLESVYGYPLDIEFGIEGTKIWLLQVRPVAAFLPALNETLKNFPFRLKPQEQLQ